MTDAIDPIVYAREALKASTPGPWYTQRVPGVPDDGNAIITDELTVMVTFRKDDAGARADARVITLAVNTLPALLDLVARLRPMEIGIDGDKTRAQCRVCGRWSGYSEPAIPAKKPPPIDHYCDCAYAAVIAALLVEQSR